MNSSSRSWTIALLSIYAIATTVVISRNNFVLRDVSVQIRNGADDTDVDNVVFVNSEKNFLYPTVHRSSQSLSSEPSTANGTLMPTFPIKTHIVTYGNPRTATTLLFNMAAVSYFLYLTENDVGKIGDIELKFWIRTNGKRTLRRTKTPMVIKTHLSLDNFLSDNVVVFAAATDRTEGIEMKQRLEREGHIVAYVQDMETLKQGGITQLVNVYVAGFGLPTKHRAILNDYFSLWEIMRQCCGQQMSSKWRNDMMPKKFKNKKLESHPTCASYDIDTVEEAFMKTELYFLIEKYPSVQPLNRPSLKDGNLNGTYCSSYNYLVRTQGLNFWGMPGGRPVRSKLDSAIKEQLRLGTAGLKERAHSLVERNNKTFNQALSELWSHSEEEKKIWLKAVLAEREGGKQYDDYGIETEVSVDNGENIDNVIEDDDEDDDDPMVEDKNELVAQPRIQASDIKKGSSRINEITSTTNRFDVTHAIFLISFGEEAAKSTLVERCILSLRRRGAWDGFVILLTDAPPERYQNEWDANVIVMHPLDEHLHASDGTPLVFTRENMSLKPKRFKTFITEYMNMDRRLDLVRLIYYLDIDIMAGNSMHTLFNALERKYNISQNVLDGDVSKLYFFTPLSDEWPLQGGTFIVERWTSDHCLALWRKEIDNMTASGRGRDQDGLRNIYQRIQLGEEVKCKLIRMENENFISFPTPRTFKKLTRQPIYPYLIHISNSVFAKWINEKQQTEYIHKVLELSKKERESEKYGKIVIQPKKSDMESYQDSPDV